MRRPASGKSKGWQDGYETRKPDAESRTPRAGRREPDAESRTPTPQFDDFHSCCNALRKSVPPPERRNS
jgi:hypothetical protein